MSALEGGAAMDADTGEGLSTGVQEESSEKGSLRD